MLESFPRRTAQLVKTTMWGAESLPMPLPQRLDKKYEMMKNEMSHYDTAITAIAFTTFVLF